MIEGSKELAQWFLQKTQSFFIENPDLSQKDSGKKNMSPESPEQKTKTTTPLVSAHHRGTFSPYLRVQFQL